MTKSINTNVKNEVKDLLNEYVVSPIDTDFITKFNEIKDQIGDLEEFKEKIGKITSSINCCQAVINQNIQNSCDAITGNIENILSDLSDETTKIDSLDEFVRKESEEIGKNIGNNSADIIQEIKNVHKGLNSNIKNLTNDLSDESEKTNSIIDKLESFSISFSEFKNQTDDYKSKITSDLLNLKDDQVKLIESKYNKSIDYAKAENKKIKDDIAKVNTDLTNKIDALLKEIQNKTDTYGSSIIERSNSNYSSIINEISNLLQCMEENNKSITNDLDNHYNNLSKDNCDNKTEISNEITELKDVSLKAIDSTQQMTSIKYKYLFIISLISGSVNLLATLAVIILFLIK